MRTITCLLLAVSFEASVLGQDKLVTTSPKQPHSIEFMGDSLRLAFVNETANKGHREIINEYVMADETLERWTKLIAVYQYPNINDYKKLTGGLVKTVKQQNPLAPIAVHSNPENTKVLIDFITWDTSKKEKITEFNAFIYQDGPPGQGVIVQHFALRAYGDDSVDFLTGMKSKRMPYLEAALQFDFPTVILE